MIQISIRSHLSLLLFLLSFSIFSYSHQPTLTSLISYGSLVKFHQPSSGKWLHSHQVRFGRGGFFSVTGYNHDDLGNYWQILEQYPYATKTYNQPVRCGDIIRLKSAIIGYNLRVDETSFGLTTQLLPMVHGMPDDRADAAINWLIKCSHKQIGQTIRFGDQIKLKHSVTGKYVELDPSSQYTQFNCRGCQIIYQIQIHGVQNDSDDQKTTFQLIGGLTFAEEKKKRQQ